jgi:hypothetical protein|tara:strand:+ start:359 stop:1150 length:792 start_codon:yes stop_codon:yes gene_type:complete
MIDDLVENVGDPAGDPDVMFNETELEGFLLKISVGGITVQDYVKRLQEDDILIAIDGQTYLSGPEQLRNTFLQEQDSENKWLLTFYRGGVVFDILIDHPLKSSFDYSTKEETDLVLSEFSKHTFGDFQGYDNFEIYRNNRGICDILNLTPDPMAWVAPPLWLLKYRLYPPLAVVFVLYLLTFVVNIYLFIATAIMVSIYISRAQTNLLRSFTMFEDKAHYMTVAASNEADVSLVVRKIDPSNKVRFEKNIIKKSIINKKAMKN